LLLNLNIFFVIALIVVISKIVSIFLRKFNLPPFITVVLFGILLTSLKFGGFANEKDIEILKILASVGMFILIFFSGLEIDTYSLRKISRNSFLISLVGVIFAFMFGFVTTYLFTKNLSLSLVLGVIFSTSSASVSTITLYKLDKLRTVEGNTIRNVSIIGDLTSILILSIIAGVVSNKTFLMKDIIIILSINLVVFLAIFALIILILPKLLNYFSFIKVEYIYFGIGLLFLFVFLFFIGEINSFTVLSAYFAGVFLSKSDFKSKLEEIISILQFVFVPIFFIFIGMQLKFTNLNYMLLLYILVLVTSAFISKIIGSGIVAKMVGFDLKRSIRIGVGVTPRGEIALIIAFIIYHYKNISLIGDAEFIVVVLIVIITIFASRNILRILFLNKRKK